MASQKFPLNSGLNPRIDRWMQDHVAPAVKRVVTAEHTFGSAANVEERIRHKLGVKPAGYRVVSQSAAGSVYRSPGGTVDTRNHLHLKSSGAGLTVTIEVF